MSWQSQAWVQDDDYYYGYVSPRLSQPLEEFDVNNIFPDFIIEQNMYYGYPYNVVAGDTIEFDVDKIYHYFEINADFYGYPAALGIVYEPLGAFMGCENLSTITIPETVYELGTHSFYQSGLESTTISPDCMFYSTTFPEDCVISYYPATTTIQTPIDFILYQDTNIPINTTITINNKVSRTLTQAYYDVDVTEVASSKTGYVRRTGTNVVIQPITYNVIIQEEDITSRTWEQGTANNTTGEFTTSSTTRIRCPEYIPITNEYIRKATVYGLDTNDTVLDFVIYSYNGTTFISASAWTASGTWLDLPTGTTNIRILLRYPDNTTTIDVTNLGSCVIKF